MHNISALDSPTTGAPPRAAPPLHRRTFRDLIATNRRHSGLLVAVFCAFVAALAFGVGLLIVDFTAPSGLTPRAWGAALAVGLGAAALALAVSAIGYLAGDRLILGLSGARPMTHEMDPQLFNVVEELAIAAGVPIPRIYEIDDPAPNAFSTGRDPQHAVVAVTSGLRQQLTREELQGVIAHEISHIRNEDIRLMLLLTVLVGSVAMLAGLIWRVGLFAPGRGGGSRNRNLGGGLILVLVVVLGLVLALVAPLLARLMQFAVSREREYLADASAVELTRDPHGLADALRRVAADPHVLSRDNSGTAQLYIVNPLKRGGRQPSTLFASHPPIEERIHRLESLTA